MPYGSRTKPANFRASPEYKPKACTWCLSLLQFRNPKSCCRHIPPIRRRKLMSGKIKQTVMHECGHQCSVAMFEHLSMEAWLANLAATDCPKCWLKKQPPTFVGRTVQSGLFAVDVMRGYPIRQELQERGYGFQGPRLVKWFRIESEREQESAWAGGHGFTISREESDGSPSSSDF